jgi:hypothetical protein
MKRPDVVTLFGDMAFAVIPLEYGAIFQKNVF